ncbi:hypothetical protein [Pseudomonas violetae]|uniref:Uncharacterized protein n=1 Tax=Pseudomonas violetae TaxID=2915813 RepID=A0ABT0ET36_9PSED|nr:hypothetical protein [Pseudomonas violetae]MCK1788896.1 hypothetical protein [Pseudomonas violetae]
MTAIEKSQPADVHIGSFSYSHNHFLILLACLGAIAFVIAHWFGVKSTVGMSWFERAGTWQMIWAYLLLPIAASGAYILKRAGHGDSALSCIGVGLGFLLGAAARTFVTS